MITSKEILDLVAEYVKSKDLDVFAASFAELFYDIEGTGDPLAIQLAYDIESLLAAMSAGLCSEAALYAAMKTTSPSLIVYHLTSDTPDSTTTKLVGAAGTEKLEHVGISPSAGFGSTTALPNTGQTNTGLLPWQQVIRA